MMHPCERGEISQEQCKYILSKKGAHIVGGRSFSTICIAESSSRAPRAGGVLNSTVLVVAV